MLKKLLNLLWISPKIVLKSILLFVFPALNDEMMTGTITQPAFTCSKSAVEAPEQCVKSFQS